ncbi:hypothetical protein B0H13DRAFT_1006046 [Mycena leptocephala]|nr:hypothetical protein B0H13DRAFT_1006046 [Mycena leptocephala]
MPCVPASATEIRLWPDAEPIPTRYGLDGRSEVGISTNSSLETYHWTTMHCMCMDGPTGASGRLAQDIGRCLQGTTGEAGVRVGVQDPGRRCCIVWTDRRAERAEAEADGCRRQRLVQVSRRPHGLDDAVRKDPLAEGAGPMMSRCVQRYIHPCSGHVPPPCLHLPVLLSYHAPWLLAVHRCPSLSLQFTYCPFSTPSFCSAHTVARLSQPIYTRVPVLLLCVTVGMYDLVCE